jgi:hypothetical protein
VTQHASLTAERWSSFDLDQQILMIGNEMNRGLRSLRLHDLHGLRLGYERILRLVDLTVEVQKGYGLRRELLRWRDLIAAMYLLAEPDPTAYTSAFRALLQLTPAAARQIPFVLGEQSTGQE